MVKLDQPSYLLYPRKRHWVEKSFLVAWLAFVGAILAFFQGYVYGLFCLVGVWYLSRRDILPLLQTRLEINPETLLGEINGQPIYVPWQDVIVAQQNGSIKHGNIHLGTVSNISTIPLGLFDGAYLWQIVQKQVPISALDEEAYTRLPAYQTHQQEKAKMIHTQTEVLRADYGWGIKVLAWGCLVFSTWMISELFKETGLTWGVLVPLTPTGISLIAICKFSQCIEMNSEAIAIVSWFGRNVMKWSEIESINYHHHAKRVTGLVCLSGDKSLRVTGPMTWKGANVTEMIELLDAQIEYHQIKVSWHKSGFSLYRLRHLLKLVIA